MLRDDLNEALKTALKGRDQKSVSTLRMVLAALKDKDIAARPKGITQIPDSEILSLLQGMIKQRRESIELYEKGGRADLVAGESAEIVVIERFLPQKMDPAEQEAAIAETVAAIGAVGIKDMGRTMAALRERYAGRIDAGQASQTVKRLLG
jgi:uncharacterized protein